MRVSELPLNQDARISNFDSGIDPESASRLRALGFIPGAILCVEKKMPFRGPLVIRTGGGTFAVERAATELIEVFETFGKDS